MYINYDNNHLQAALEVIMEKIANAKKQEEYESNSEEKFLEMLAQELYRLIRGIEKNLWCDHSAKEVAMNIAKIKSIETTNEYQQLKNIISDVYEYGIPQDGLWPKIYNLVKNEKTWVLEVWNNLKNS